MKLKMLLSLAVLLLMPTNARWRDCSTFSTRSFPGGGRQRRADPEPRRCAGSWAFALWDRCSRRRAEAANRARRSLAASFSRDYRGARSCRCAIGSITLRSRRAGSSEASIQNAGSNGKNATAAPGGSALRIACSSRCEAGGAAITSTRSGASSRPAVGADRETGLFSGMRDALASRDLDQVGFEAVAARDHESARSSPRRRRADAAVRPTLRRSARADGRRRARSGSPVRADQLATDFADQREHVLEVVRSELDDPAPLRWSAAAAGSPSGGASGSRTRSGRRSRRRPGPPQAGRRAPASGSRSRRRRRSGLPLRSPSTKRVASGERETIRLTIVTRSPGSAPVPAPPDRSPRRREMGKAASSQRRRLRGPTGGPLEPGFPTQKTPVRAGRHTG